VNPVQVHFFEALDSPVSVLVSKDVFVRPPVVSSHALVFTRCVYVLHVECHGHLWMHGAAIRRFPSADRESG
jgi:hypothetical protein